jgi:hypothetical protein
MKSFLRNPYLFLLSLRGYEVRPRTMILESMIRVTHGGWLQRLQDNGTIKDYEYNLYTI